MFDRDLCIECHDNAEAFDWSQENGVVLVSGRSHVYLPDQDQMRPWSRRRYDIKRIGDDLVTIHSRSGCYIDRRSSVDLTVKYQSYSLVFSAGNWWIV